MPSPVWDGNEVWLIVAVAVTFAAFPMWYATMLSGFYPVFVVVLVALIVRGVSFEFRGHAEEDRSRRFWGGALTVGSLVIPLGLGIVLGNLLGGVPIDPQGEFVGDVGDLFSPYAVLTGVTITLVCLLHGAAFLALRTVGDMRLRALRVGRVVGPLTVLAVLAFVVLTQSGSGGVLWSVVEFGAVLAAIAAAVLMRAGRDGAAFAATSATMAAVVVSLFVALHPRVMVSSLGAANDLTVSGAASSPYALTVMTVTLAILLPVVLAYQAWTYHVFRSRLRHSAPADDGPPPRPPAGTAADGTAADDAANAGAGDPVGQSTQRREAQPRYSRPMIRLVWLLFVWFLTWLITRLRTGVAAHHPAGQQ